MRRSALPLAAFLCVLFALANGFPAQGEALQSKMIWLASSPPGKQAYVVFRKRFRLETEPKSARLCLFADTRYILWINGRYVERGPCRFDPKAPSYDEIDARAYLRSGDNVIAVLVHHLHDGKSASVPGELNGRSMRHAPGLTASLHLRDSEGRVTTLFTDTTWRGSAQTRFLPGPLTGIWASIHDRIDARRDPGDWTLPEFDDSMWEQATPVDGKLWGPLSPRPIARLKETPITPVAIWRPQETERHSLGAGLPVTLTAGQEVRLDVGQMCLAYDLIDLDAEAGSEIEVLHGHGYRDSNLDEVYGSNRYIAKAGRQTYMSGDVRGFRYLAIRALSGRITLRGVTAVNRLYPFEVVGRFQSGDPFLDELWQRSVRTVQLCSEDGYLDCNARERVEWMGDAALVELPVTQVAFAVEHRGRRLIDGRLIGNLLDHIAQSQTADGRLKAHHPSDRWDIHGYIEDYACLWVQALRQYYDTGMGFRISHLLPVMRKQLQWFLDRRTPRGLVKGREFIFFDNPLSYKECEGLTLNACVIGALRNAAYLEEKREPNPRFSGAANRYRQIADELAQAIHRELWDEAEGAYHGGILDGKQTPPTAHAAMLALYYGIVPEAQRARLTAWLVAHRQQIGTPYTHFFLFDALYRADTPEMDALALTVMRERWASTLARKDVDTVFEGFGGGSLCHNMGAVPAYYLSAWVLGVRMEGSIDKRRIRIEPHLGDLPIASGSVMTAHGLTTVSWSRGQDRKSLDFRVEIPRNTRAFLALPVESASPTLELDGKPMPSRLWKRQGCRLLLEVGAGAHRGIVRE